MSPARTKRRPRVLRQFGPPVPCLYGDASWPFGWSGSGRRCVEQVDGHALPTMGGTNQPARRATGMDTSSATQKSPGAERPITVEFSPEIGAPSPRHQ